MGGTRRCVGLSTDYRQGIDKFSPALMMFTKRGKHLGVAMGRLGQRLRELREQQGFTVRQFAERIERTPGYVSRIEARGEIPSPELLCVIAEAYRIAPEELLELAKECYLERAEREVQARNSSALALFRKGRK